MSSAASAGQFDISGPAGSVSFGTFVAPLPNGNIVVVDPDGPVSNVGAVYLYSPQGSLISTLTGSQADDHVGSFGIVVLKNGNFVVKTPNWNGGRGAATWVDADSGLSGVVSEANSLVGSAPSDLVGYIVSALDNGNYLVDSPFWANNIGAIAWGNGSSGVNGVLSSANALVGSVPDDRVGNGVVQLTNGNYVVLSPFWSNGSAASAGAATWGSGSSGVKGVVSAANSLVGSQTDDSVGYTIGVLKNGNYVIGNRSWANGPALRAGAVTWGNGTGGVKGLVSTANSLVGTQQDDQVGMFITPLSNGHYVVGSRGWSNGSTANAGAATWRNGTLPTSGEVSASNSLVGTHDSDRVGDRVAALSNGNYVVVSSSWDNGAAADVGAVTWANGSNGATVGVVSPANSLVGTTTGDAIGSGVLALTNGNYVVLSSSWHNAGADNAGAVTWASGGAPTSAVVSPANSFVGATSGDFLGSVGAIALNNGNYVVRCPACDNGAIVDAGAVAFGNGSGGTSGAISATNALVGTTQQDFVGSAVTALSNGNYVVVSAYWHGASGQTGAATWGNGATGITSAVTEANSLVGSTVGTDQIDVFAAAALANGNYVVASPLWDLGGTLDVGAATWGNGRVGIAGAISPDNSLTGGHVNEFVGKSGIVAYSNSSYLVRSKYFDSGSFVYVDAVALLRGSGPTRATIQQVETVRGAIGTTAVVYDATRDVLVVGRPTENKVTVLKLDLLFANGFE